MSNLMTHKTNTITHETLAIKRLRHRIDTIAHVIEDVLSDHANKSVHVTGGKAHARTISFEIARNGGVISKRAAMQDISTAIGHPVSFTETRHEWLIEVNRNDFPVDLIALMHTYQAPDLHATEALLGLDSLGVPVTLNMKDNGNIAIVGAADTGKSALLKTIAATLVATNRPSKIQLLAFQAGEGGLQDLNALPTQNFLRPVVNNPNEAHRTMYLLAQRKINSGPHIVILIDNLNAVVGRRGVDRASAFAGLLKRPDVTIIAAMRSNQTQMLNLHAWQTRIVGRVPNRLEAMSITWRYDMGAEKLSTPGAFLLANSNGPLKPHYFQAAYADWVDFSFIRGGNEY